MADTIGNNALKRDQHFTLSDWASWAEDERWELIEGTAYNMSPAPRVPHQNTARDLIYRLSVFLEGKPCQPFMAPVDVYLEASGIEDTVVQPDVFVVCDPAIIEDKGIKGTPDFIAEILSESTAYKDLGHKKKIYERAGVREYWIIHPGTGTVSVLLREGSAFAIAREYASGQEIPSTALPGFIWRFKL